MRPTLPNAAPSQEVRTYDNHRKKPAKVERLQSDVVGLGRTESDFGHGPKIWDAVVRGHGSVNATAITMEDTDPTQLKREITTGSIRLKKFFEADEAALCEFAEYILSTFQPARKSKRDLALERLPELFAVVIEGLTEDEDTK